MYQESRVRQGVRALHWCEAEANQNESAELHLSEVEKLKCHFSMIYFLPGRVRRDAK